VGDLPPFTAAGLLPPGDYPLTIEELEASVLVTGPPNIGLWDAAWRRQLVQNLSHLIGQLWAVGITEIFIDGSFVEDKPHPNDIDGYFVCGLDDLRNGTLVQALNALEPTTCWTWSVRHPHHSSTKPQLPMWHKYRVELYPHVGQSSGILDEHGHPMLFPSAFRQQRDTRIEKGIIRVVRSHEDRQQ
jgi:hypothetical protein